MKLDFPATRRNREAIWRVLSEYIKFFQSPCDVIEVAAGSGQHADYFLQQSEDIRWLSTDPAPEHVQSLESYRADSPVAHRFREPLCSSIQELPERLREHDGANILYAANVLHISTADTTQSLFRAAAALLKPDGLLIIYGPFNLDGEFTAASNAAFDASLRSRNPEWGIKDVGWVSGLGSSLGFRLMMRYDMPANNMMLVYGRKEQASG